MKDIPDHWRHFYEKLFYRGWIDEDTHEPFADVNGKFNSIPELSIDDNSLEVLRKLLLDLGIRDNNSIIAGLYFELARRSRKVNFYSDNAKSLFELDKKSAWDSVEPLPVSENDYKKIALLLGKIAISDSDYKKVDEMDKRYGEIIPRTFCYLQRRAREGNGFNMDDEIDVIENKIIGILEQKKAEKGK